jgi:hypothetical protein
MIKPKRYCEKHKVYEHMCDCYKQTTGNKPASVTGLEGLTPKASVNVWSDMIDEAKERGAINDLSTIAYRLMVICATGGFKAP